jgi:hypothetical protein
MIVRRRAGAVGRAVQSALPLGHAEVRWDALPRAVQDEVLTRWCELLSAVVTDQTHDDDVAARETRP